ncbi:MAG: hypothetical protein AAFO96_11650 [Bacteroidota bacterium]
MNQGTKTVLVVGGTAAVGVWYTHYLWNLQEAGDKLDIRLSHFDNLTVSGGDLIGEFKLAFTNNGSVDLELQKVHLGLFLDDTELTRLSKVGTADYSTTYDFYFQVSHTDYFYSFYAGESASILRYSQAGGIEREGDCQRFYE